MSKGGLAFRLAVVCLMIAFSLYDLAQGEVLWPLAFLLLVAGFLLDMLAVLSHASRPTLAVASYLTGITAQILGGVLLIVNFYFFQN